MSGSGGVPDTGAVPPSGSVIIAQYTSARKHLSAGSRYQGQSQANVHLALSKASLSEIETLLLKKSKVQLIALGSGFRRSHDDLVQYVCRAGSVRI